MPQELTTEQQGIEREVLRLLGVQQESFRAWIRVWQRAPVTTPTDDTINRVLELCQQHSWLAQYTIQFRYGPSDNAARVWAVLAVLDLYSSHYF